MTDNNDNTTPTTQDTLSFITEICGKLKKIKRTGWVRSHIPLPESDSDHMHRCAMCAMLVASSQQHCSHDDNDDFHPNKIDNTKLLKMALTHDVCEALAGDITPHCDEKLIATKYEREERAMIAIREMVGDPLGGELVDLWREYEEQESLEAIYCKDIDKFEMVVQAFEYERDYLIRCDHDHDDDDRGEEQEGKELGTISEPLRSFFVSTNSVMKSPLFRRLDCQLRSRREVMLKERGWQVSEEERQQYN